MTIERIKGESRRRIAYISEHVNRFNTALDESNLPGAEKEITKIAAIIRNCKLDIEAIKIERIKELENDKYPQYVIACKHTALRHENDGVYYRDAGCWRAQSVWKDGKLIWDPIDSRLEHLRGKELIECTSKEWRESNKGHL